MHFKSIFEYKTTRLQVEFCIRSQAFEGNHSLIAIFTGSNELNPCNNFDELHAFLGMENNNKLSGK